jgi:PTH1 family peptidyl-tRNA hydrolase
MNLAGTAVQRLFDYYRIEMEQLVVVHDDLDLPFETIRLKAGGGHGGHKGLMSIIEHLGATDFLRVRLGIGRPLRKSMVEGYVLSPFTEEETTCLPRLLQTAGEAVADIISTGIAAAMNRYHGNIATLNQEG